MTASEKLVVWKFPLAPSGAVEPITAPADADFLTAAYDERTAGISVWAEVDPTAAVETRLIRVYATGEAFGDGQHMYIGTAHIGPYVWHVYEVLS